MSGFLALACAALAASTIAYGVASSKLGTPFRFWIDDVSPWDGLADLFHCPYCVGFWAAVGIVAALGPCNVGIMAPVGAIAWPYAILSVTGGAALVTTVAWPPKGEK